MRHSRAAARLLRGGGKLYRVNSSGAVNKEKTSLKSAAPVKVNGSSQKTG